MASIIMPELTVFSLPGAFNRSPSVSPHKVSRVCFTSASKKTQDQHARSDDRDDGHRAADVPEMKAREMEETYGELKQKAKEKALDSGEKVADKAREGMEGAKGMAADEAKEKTKSMGREGTERAKGMAERAGEAVDDAKEKTKSTAYEAREKTKQVAGSAFEKTRDVAGSAAERTKEGVGKVGETVEKVGERAKDAVKNTVNFTWDAAKGTGQF
ncbi:hypothetical protein AKJ16_DCAP18531 [Drosera capensis]